MLSKIKNKILNCIKSINDSYEFKPLLSEIEESPISPLGRFTFWTVTSLIIITILWLVIGKIDIVVSARGIVIPDGEAKIIQPLETGVVKQILVKEGDFVKKGQLLILVDTSTTEAQLKSVNKNLEQSKIEAERLKSSGNNSEFSAKTDNKELAEELETQQKLYQENLSAMNSQVAAKQQEISQIKNQIDAAVAQKRDYQYQLTNAEDRERRLKNVIDVIAYNEYQEAQNKTNSLQESLNRTISEIKKLEAQSVQIQKEIMQIKSDFKSQNLTTLANTQKQINELEANKEEIEFSNQNQKITAPCDGYIDKLLIHTIGGVVTPAQELIALTPVEQPLLIKAQVLNRDVGFIKEGMPVSIKIDTFEFQKYGILHGTVKSISQNSIKDEKLGEVYEVYIIPKEHTLLVEGKEKQLSTGMTLNAEIEINKRRIIEFFIYPLIKYLDEGISVR
mgnify:CR=1 FL=1